MHTLVITSYIRHLTNLKAILVKAKTWQEEGGYKEEVILALHLAVDQFPLVRQIQMATDFAKKSGGLLTGVDTPSYEDNEKTFEELFARIDKTVAFLESLPKDVVAENLETKMVILPWYKGKGLTAKYYIEEYALPQFYFHYTTAYAILRNYGLKIGKGDFLGAVELKDIA